MIKSILFAFILIPLISPAGENSCYEDSYLDTWGNEIGFIASHINEPSIQKGNCGVIKKSDDYWFCEGISNRNCGVTKSSDEYWLCQSIVTGACGVNKKSDNYWLCESLKTGACGVNKESGNYWFCESIKKRNCGLNMQSEKYWLCEGIKNPINSILEKYNHYESGDYLDF